MGEIIRLSCKRCDFNKQLKIGAGMMSIRASVVEGMLEKEDLKEWRNLQENDRIGFFSWQYDLAYCESCHDLKSVFNVNIKTKDGTQMQLGRRCDTCHNQLESMTRGEDVKCPLCGDAQVQRMRIGMWD